MTSLRSGRVGAASRSLVIYHMRAATFWQPQGKNITHMA